MLFLVSILPVLAQENARIEIPIRGTHVDIETIPVGEAGVLLVSKPNKSTFSIEKYNTNLEKIWVIEGPVENNYDLLATSYDGQSVFLLYGKIRGSNFKIIKVNIGPGFVETFDINPIDKFEITEFQTIGYSVFLAGMVRNESVLIYTQLNTGQSKLLPTAIKGTSVIQSMELDTLHQLIHVSFAVKKGKQTKIIGRSYEQTGKLYSEISVTPEDDYSLLNGRVQILNDSTQLLVGTYGYRNMQSSSNPASQGFYISKVVNERTSYTRYHSFTSFSNFFQFLNERQQEKIERKIQKKKETGNDLKLNYQLLVHDIVPYRGKYLLVAEVFYPDFKYQTPGLGGGYSYGRGIPYRSGLYNPYLYNPMYSGRGYNQQVFDGFVYTHAIVAGISDEGDLLWDNSINFDEVKSMTLRQKIKLQNDAMGNSKLAYSQEGDIKSKIIKENHVIDPDRTLDNRTLHEADKVKRTSSDDVDYWFGNYFISWGFQRIINGEDVNAAKARRNVFYLNKISF